MIGKIFFTILFIIILFFVVAFILMLLDGIDKRHHQPIVTHSISSQFDIIKEPPSIQTNADLLNNMSHSDLLIFYYKRFNIPLCRMCRNFKGTVTNPDVCEWRGMDSKCIDGFKKWLEDTNPEGEDNAEIDI